MIGYYFNAGSARSGRSRVMFRSRVDDALAQIRNEHMGKLIQSEGFDEDGDMMLRIDISALPYLLTVAKAHKLDLWKASEE